MANTANKTVETTENVFNFIRTVADDTRREDSLRLIAIITSETGLEPRMWGTNIVGFGRYHYRYDSGHEGDAPLVGFSPRKQELVLYLAADFEGRTALLHDLGKHRSGKACVYLKKLADANEQVLRKMITATVDWIGRHYPDGR
ncbi:DUF1801 domain-containing protein [Parapedobacter lycopersici]|uniref:DUF1801 domain-containing protein n=1 Tax=Parapedobacter lycopersici TaxID=1864939 RepID=UPI00214D16AC|nr:DUF1801 domain-containing protein [Parapedobacter lycopersici]